MRLLGAHRKKARLPAKGFVERLSRPIARQGVRVEHFSLGRHEGTDESSSDASATIRNIDEHCRDDAIGHESETHRSVTHARDYECPETHGFGHDLFGRSSSEDRLGQECTPTLFGRGLQGAL